MSDSHEGPAGGAGGSAEPPESPEPGSVSEEAVRLMSALSDWAKTQGADYASSAAGAAHGAGDAWHNVSEHLATDSAECRFCPICRVVHAFKETSPEVKTNLAIAATSLMQAAASLLATQPPKTDDAPVEKINLDDEWDQR